MKYKIVYLKENFQDIASTYPSLIEMLYSSQQNSYDTKQVELLFKPLGQSKEKLLKMIQERDDYHYFHGVHQLNNPITDENVTIKLNEFDIEVDEKSGNHVIFDIMRTFSKNFYMIMA
ncbi:hypothetical protein [Candidatus Stoquefichus sp. SB1]|uniref:hypothetical protein n=1 Tax=Candidatus Stoquefichus sp. SB1 TaxID=1658109 RepID=UPI00067F0A5A|nr:hypothetical protein [Candidatus Stoquefichus sp. SB1]